MQSLPQDLLVKMLLFATSDAKDICRLSQVCVSFRNATSVPHLWQHLACFKYGENLAILSAPLYESNWKALFIDDNKRGAFPTITTTMICNYAFNYHDHYYCCIIMAVKWDRCANEIRVYIDVRGEDDLRHPLGSSITQLPINFKSYNEYILTSGRANTGVWGQTVTLRPVRFVSEIAPARNHFKGYLAFPVNDDGDLRAGVYCFCYANAYIQGRGPDYRPINFFSITRQPNGLAEPFSIDRQVIPPSVSYTADQSPFADDTPEIERNRWQAHVPQEVMSRGTDRSRAERPWYV